MDDTTSRIPSIDELMRTKIKSASKTETSFKDAPSVMTSFTREDIDNLAVTSLIDVLKYAPGIETSIDPQGEYRIAFRGLRNDADILILLNGHPINNFYDGKAIYDFPTDIIEKIEIIRGPVSAIYGTNAIVGVINIFTIQDESSVSLKGGTNSTYSGNVNYHIKTKKSNFSILGGYRQTNGANGILKQDDKVDEIWSLTYEDSTQKTNRWLKEGYISSSFNRGNFNMNLLGIARDRGSWVGPLLVLSPDSKISHNQFVWDISYNLKVSDNVIVVPKLYDNIIYHNYENQETPDGFISPISGETFTDGKITKEKYTAYTVGGEVFTNIKVTDNFSFVYGTVFEKNSIRDYEISRNYKLIGEEYVGEFGNYDSVAFDQNDKVRTIFSYYVEGDYHSEKLNIIGGFRYDDNSDFRKSFNPRFSVIYKPFKRIHFKALFGSAYRAPTFRELHDQTNLGPNGIRGNNNLSPKTIQTSEVEVGFTFSNILIKTSGYYNRTKNLIRNYDPQGSGAIGIFENIGDLNGWGVEFEIIGLIKDKLKVFANTSYQYNLFSWNEEVAIPIFPFYIEDVGSRLMKNIPLHRINLGVDYNFSKFNLFAGGNYGSSSLFNNRQPIEGLRNNVNIPMYIRGNISLTYQAIDKLKIRIAANNIGAKYSDPEESSNIDALGSDGMIQPTETILLSLIYQLK